MSRQIDDIGKKRPKIFVEEGIELYYVSQFFILNRSYITTYILNMSAVGV